MQMCLFRCPMHWDLQMNNTCNRRTVQCHPPKCTPVPTDCVSNLLRGPKLPVVSSVPVRNPLRVVPSLVVSNYKLHHKNSSPSGLHSDLHCASAPWALPDNFQPNHWLYSQGTKDRDVGMSKHSLFTAMCKQFSLLLLVVLLCREMISWHTLGPP